MCHIVWCQYYPTEWILKPRLIGVWGTEEVSQASYRDEYVPPRTRILSHTRMGIFPIPSRMGIPYAFRALYAYGTL